MAVKNKLQDIIIDGATCYFTATEITDPKVNLETIEADYLGTAKSSVAVTAKPLIREIEHLGKRERKTVYDERITGWEVTAEADILDLNEKTLETSLFIKDATGTAPTKHDKYIPKANLSASDYKNLVIVGKMKSTSENVVLVIKNTYNAEGISIETKDNDESATKMVFNGHYEQDSDKAPIEIFAVKPSAEALVGTALVNHAEVGRTE